MFSPTTGGPLTVVALLDRAIGALAHADTASLVRVLDDCAQAETPGTPEEFSRALTQQAAFEKLLEQTAKNIRLIRGEKRPFTYGRGRERSS